MPYSRDLGVGAHAEVEMKARMSTQNPFLALAWWTTFCVQGGACTGVVHADKQRGLPRAGRNKQRAHEHVILKQFERLAGFFLQARPQRSCAACNSIRYQ